MSFRIELLIRLSHMVIILFVRRHIDYFVCYDRIFRVRLVNLPVRSLDKSVFIDSGICRKGVDQTDIRTFRSLDRTHSSVVGIMNVADLKSGTVSGKTSRSECRQTSLVRQLTERIVLIHELGQLGGTEKFFHRSRHRLNIDQRLWRNSLQILGRHPLTDNSFQTGESDPVLVLQQLSNRPDTPVSKMVNIVVISKAVFQMHIVIDGREDVLLCNMLRNQLVKILSDGFLKLLCITCRLFH